jgi:protoporphyrin/coproporphyrin ferrochelatase
MPIRSNPKYDALLIVGFGGPERREDVIPFLENVLRGRNVARDRMLQVAEHYYHFDGKSPINDQTRSLIRELGPELERNGIDLPIYWGNRNWNPMLGDTLKAMTDAGVTRALALVLAAYSSYSSCRQYREDIENARVLAGPNAPVLDKIRVFYNHPDFIAANASRVAEAIEQLPEDRRKSVQIAFTAHSIPSSMAQNCDYERQLSETCRVVAESLGIGSDRWRLVYQSRSGRPTDPWLEPDILDHLAALKEQGVSEVVVHPIGFLSDHLEVLYDLDHEAMRKADELSLHMVRAGTVGVDRGFIGMLRKLIQERVSGAVDRPTVGRFGPNPDVCGTLCCLPPQARRPA